MIGNISPVQLVIILVIVAIIFGTKKLRSMGSDVGGAVKSFRKAMHDDDATQTAEQMVQQDDSVIEGKAESQRPHQD